MNVEYRVLGPLEVLLDGEPVAVPAGRCHVLLAVLLLRANQFLPVDELIDRVWDGEPPTADRAHKTLQMVVRRLRVALGDADCVRTRPGGYQAAVEPDQLDLARFRALAGSGDFGAASALWRGSVLANVPSERLHREEVPQLVNERLAVLERRIDAELAQGLSGELVAELRSLVAEHPLREPFWRHLMLALYRSGQQAEALTAYQDVRTRLAEELGVDPGPELQELHQQILRAEVAPGRRPQVPRQLPAGVRNYVGRDAELDLLDKASGVTVVHGVGGVGKTALVLRWAREAREDFPDGDLYLNLRGFDPEGQPVDPAAAAEMLLVGLGVDEIPAAAEARFALLRTTLVDQRLLLVLDNAASPRQVLPLLPGAAGVRVVITSRNQLRALVSQHDATAIGLRQLEFEDARSLLAAVLGSARLDAEPEAAREIVERCAGLPLALRVFAERVARFPDIPLHEFATELHNERLDAFSDFYDVDVRAVFSWSYRALDDESARMFRLLSVHPGQDFDVSAAAAIAGVSVAQARRLLERLVADALVQSRGLGRYCLHDLLGAYAAELCGDDEAAALRMTEWYVHTLQQAVLRKDAPEMAVAGDVTSGVTPQEFASRFDALAWCREEWDNLGAVMHAALSRGWNSLAQYVPAHLSAYLLVHPLRSSEAIEMFEAVLGLDTSLEQRGVLQLRLATLYNRVGRVDDARSCFEHAVRVASAEDEKPVEVSALINVSMLYSNQGRHEEALELCRRGAELARELGDLYRENAALSNIAVDLFQLGRYDESLAASEQALAVGAKRGDEHQQVLDRYSKGIALVGLGRFEEAKPELEIALDGAQKLGSVVAEAWVSLRLGIALNGLGMRAAAEAAWRRTAVIQRELTGSTAQELAARLAELE
ncbi:BTAD domain-containing putative transcriptional regulator [Lentzea sp. BCCO 10_0856]|uniref:BTAD domain-containing putative transcriptional regulator n=1 Tax=Lentzea miocenica TaxID=3095431 RepID=A0ABU4T2F6_9PSEU|nr:BTAD domain-containing putative transcriptional regulator [Lentzea sp. BCCO 10_0856]MDX8032343.1 BTAD domain-containing putative transcriptional regulator [Lentzea sp. BCCO 10_0856]